MKKTDLDMVQVRIIEPIQFAQQRYKVGAVVEVPISKLDKLKPFIELVTDLPIVEIETAEQVIEELEVPEAVEETNSDINRTIKRR